MRGGPATSVRVRNTQTCRGHTSTGFWHTVLFSSKEESVSVTFQLDPSILASVSYDLMVEAAEIFLATPHRVVTSIDPSAQRAPVALSSFLRNGLQTRHRLPAYDILVSLVTPLSTVAGFLSGSGMYEQVNCDLFLYRFL